MSFSEKTVIVTGAAKGIGRAIATAFSSEGAFVIIADIDETECKRLMKMITDRGESALFIHTDVSDPVSIADMVEKAAYRSGTIDILINNAGISEFRPFYEPDVSKWDRVLHTNLRSAYLCSQEAAKRMRYSGGGAIINIASTRALMSEPGSEAYAASKGGLLALTHAMAASLADDRITVNAISPGWVHTGNIKDLRKTDHMQHLSRRVGKPEDISRACLFLCHPENNFITGENLIIDGGMTRKMLYEP